MAMHIINNMIRTQPFQLFNAELIVCQTIPSFRSWSAGLLIYLTTKSICASCLICHSLTLDAKSLNSLRNDIKSSAWASASSVANPFILPALRIFFNTSICAHIAFTLRAHIVSSLKFLATKKRRYRRSLILLVRVSSAHRIVIASRRQRLVNLGYIF